jgi:hypothetical protein
VVILPTFRDNLSVLSSGVKNPKESLLLDSERSSQAVHNSSLLERKYVGIDWVCRLSEMIRTHQSGRVQYNKIYFNKLVALTRCSGTPSHISNAVKMGVSAVLETLKFVAGKGTKAGYHEVK